MLAPKKQKYRKAHKGRVSKNAKRGTEISFGIFIRDRFEIFFISFN